MFELEPKLRALMLRFACFYLVSIMPDEGIPELYETLSEMHEFYNTRIQEDKPLLLPQPKKIQATIGKSIVRPEFSIESEVQPCVGMGQNDDLKDKELSPQVRRSSK